MSEPFGNMLRAMRERALLSQSKLAEQADFDHSYVSRLESGARMPARDAVHRLADALDLAPDDRDALLRSADFLPSSLSGMLSCPLLGDLDAVHRAAAPDRKAWIESLARLALDAA